MLTSYEPGWVCLLHHPSMQPGQHDAWPAKQSKKLSDSDSSFTLKSCHIVYIVSIIDWYIKLG
ncbi:hypothetical protein OUZ56_013986 [Daphnia magna]|uniref:Uncharacterized protein n=1 Tax=Daphnia magna TaxID=35525 RepID=A0ABQ9Z8N0_9CRUS|nr:hypothetical protein OUZ56_013986 [Daphnia magna]